MIRRLLCWLGWHNKEIFLMVRESQYGTIYSFWACEQCGRKYVFMETSEGRSPVNPTWAHYALKEQPK